MSLYESVSNSFARIFKKTAVSEEEYKAVERDYNIAQVLDDNEEVEKNKEWLDSHTPLTTLTVHKVRRGTNDTGPG